MADDMTVEQSSLVTRECTFIEWRTDTHKYALDVGTAAAGVSLALHEVSRYDGRRRHIAVVLDGGMAELLIDALKEALGG